MSSHKKILANMGAQMLGKILGIVASLVIVKIITRMGTEFYGNYVTSYEFLAFFGIIADAGLFNIAVRDMSKYREKTEFILANTFSMRLILILLVTILAGTSAQFIPSYASEVKSGIWITSISMALTIIAGTLSSVLQARMKIQYFALGLMISKIVLAILIFIISKNTNLLSHPFFTMLWAGVIANLIFCLFVSYFASREIKIRLGFDFEHWKKTIKESLPYGSALILQTLYLRANTVIISILLGASAVGIFGVASRVTESFIVLGSFFGQAILPRLSSQEDNPEKFQKTLTWGIEILTLCALPIIIGVTRYAPKIVDILSNENFISKAGFFGSDSVLSLIVITTLFTYQNQLFSFALVAKKQQKFLLLVNAVAFALNVALNILLIPKYGLVASSYTTILCESIVFGMLFAKIKSHSRLPFSPQNILAIIIANSLLASLIFLTPLGEKLLLGSVIGGICYLSVLFFFRKSILPKVEKSE